MFALLLFSICAFHFHSTQHLSNPAVYLILPESVWEGSQPSRARRGLFVLVHTFTNRCTFKLHFSCEAAGDKSNWSHTKRRNSKFGSQTRKRMAVDSWRPDALMGSPNRSAALCGFLLPSRCC
jgi:hypothetical protein